MGTALTLADVIIAFDVCPITRLALGSVEGVANFTMDLNALEKESGAQGK